MNRSRLVYIPVLLSLCLLGNRCSILTTVAGGGSEGGNPVIIGKLYAPDTHPAAGAIVRFIPSGHDPRDSIQIDTAVTDTDGIYTSDTLAPGCYNVLAESNGYMAFIDSIRVTDSGALAHPAWLKVPGSMVCRVELSAGQNVRSAAVILLGTDIMAAPDSSGKITLTPLAEGSYAVRIVTSLNSSQKKDTSFIIIAGRNDTLTRAIQLPDTTLPAHFTQAIDSASFGMRKEFGCVAFGGKMWVIGGIDSSRNYNDIWNSSDGVTWTKVTDSAGFAKRRDHATVVFNNSIWVIGGTGDSSKKFCDAWHSTDGVTWTKAIDSVACFPRYNPATVVFNGRIWIMGGYTTNGFVRDVWSSSDGISWTMAVDTAGFSGRLAPQAVVFKNRIWLMGGRNQTTDLADVWYSPDGIQWTRATDSAAFPPRSAFSAVAAANVMVITGGVINTTTTSAGDAWYSYDGISWIQLQTPANFTTKSSHASLNYHNMIWIIGQANGENRSDVWTLF